MRFVDNYQLVRLISLGWSRQWCKHDNSIPKGCNLSKIPPHCILQRWLWYLLFLSFVDIFLSCTYNPLALELIGVTFMKLERQTAEMTKMHMVEEWVGFPPFEPIIGIISSNETIHWVLVEPQDLAKISCAPIWFSKSPIVDGPRDLGGALNILPIFGGQSTFEYTKI